MSRFEIDFLADYTDDALLNELRRVAALLAAGQPLTKKAYGGHAPRVSHSAIQRRFGGWKEALQKAGLAHLYHGPHISQKMRLQTGKTLTDGDLISEMKRVHALVGKEWLTSTDFDRHAVASTAVIRNRFGSFRKGLERAGISHHPFTSRKHTDEQCFENLADVWTHLGRAPRYREMCKPLSRVRGKTYVTRWGTFRKALQAFVDWANDESADSSNAGDLKPANDPPVRTNPIVGFVSRTQENCREVRPGLRFKVFLRDRFRCVACGRSPANDLQVELHADHVVAVANGGKTVLENLQTLCQACNLGKGRMHV